MRRRLDELAVPYEIIPCDPALADTAAFCATYGYALEDSANTIVVIGKSDPPRYVACVVLATTRLDVNRAVRQRLGIRRVSFASAEDTRQITGQEIGGVTVFGLPPELSIWVDSRVMERERIILGGGSRSFKVLAPPTILRALPGVEGSSIAFRRQPCEYTIAATTRQGRGAARATLWAASHAIDREETWPRRRTSSSSSSTTFASTSSESPGIPT